MVDQTLDLSCSQHDLFRLEIHKSFDCFSLPDMSFQSESLRAIPWPGFVIYISTIVWSSDFEEHWGGDRYYLAWPPLLSPETKRYTVLVKSYMCTQLCPRLLILSKRLCSKESESNQRVIKCVLMYNWIFWILICRSVITGNRQQLNKWVDL